MGKQVAFVAVLALVATSFFIVSSADGAPPEAKQASRAYLDRNNVPSSGIALEGYCPVAYFAVDKAVRGSKEFAADHKGITYHFVSADARDMFTKHPEKYVPAYGGWCAFGMAVKDKFPVDPTNFKIVDGTLLVFLKNSGVDALEIWNGKNEEKLLKKAAAHWKKVQG